jgi:hypothetical protein
MEYTYILENIANKDFTINDANESEFYILCYRIETQCKYPFLQFMMEKIPFCNGLIKEQFVLPHIKNQEKLVENVLNKVNQMLVTMGLTNIFINDNMYKGIIFSYNTGYILINISDILVNAIQLSRNSLYWFVLPTEIINSEKVCGFDIDEDVIRLFVENPQISILKNVRTNINYNLPDAVYTGCNDLKQAEFNAVFGNNKTKTFNSCGEYYFFNRLFENVITNNFINRYALFVEGKLHMEKGNEFSLTDVMILEPCINICYTNNCRKEDILVKKYENFISLSYHNKNSFL